MNSQAANERNLISRELGVDKDQITSKQPKNHFHSCMLINPKNKSKGISMEVSNQLV